jgi:hypothetical protein
MEKVLNRPVVYEIIIHGQLKNKWAGWLDGDMAFQHTQGDSPNTTIHVAVPDQAALRGVLNRIWDLNLSLISVNLVKEITNGGGNHAY